jgi:hypothetical protein
MRYRLCSSYPFCAFLAPFFSHPFTSSLELCLIACSHTNTLVLSQSPSQLCGKPTYHLVHLRRHFAVVQCSGSRHGCRIVPGVVVECKKDGAYQVILSDQCYHIHQDTTAGLIGAGPIRHCDQEYASAPNPTVTVGAPLTRHYEAREPTHHRLWARSHVLGQRVCAQLFVRRQPGFPRLSSRLCMSLVLRLCPYSIHSASVVLSTLS